MKMSKRWSYTVNHINSSSSTEDCTDGKIFRRIKSECQLVRTRSLNLKSEHHFHRFIFLLIFFLEIFAIFSLSHNLEIETIIRAFSFGKYSEGG